MPDPVRLCATFEAADMTALRHVAADYAAGCGLCCAVLEDFMVGIGEIMLNVLRHGGGRGTLEMWFADRRLTCVIADRGPGLPPSALVDRPLPAPLEAGGRGLPIARQLCDDMAVTAGPWGTTVRLVKTVPVAHTAARPLALADGVYIGPHIDRRDGGSRWSRWRASTIWVP